MHQIQREFCNGRREGKSLVVNPHLCSCGNVYWPAEHLVPSTKSNPNPNDIGLWFTCPLCHTTGVILSESFIQTYGGEA